MGDIGYLAQQVINGLQLGFVYALIALGYTMVYGIIRLINFAHGDVFMLGAFVSYFAISYFGVTRMKILEVFSPAFGPVLGTGLVILMAMAICAAVAVMSSTPAYSMAHLTGRSRPAHRRGCTLGTASPPDRPGWPSR